MRTGKTMSDETFSGDLNRRSIEQLREMILLLEERIQVLGRAAGSAAESIKNFSKKLKITP